MNILALDAFRSKIFTSLVNRDKNMLPDMSVLPRKETSDLTNRTNKPHEKNDSEKVYCSI